MLGKTENILNSIATEQAVWSQTTFGTDSERGPIAPLKHLKLEADEAIASPSDIAEYADCFLLILDASRRAGFDLDALLNASYAKLQICKQRIYRKPEPGNNEPILHEK